MTKGYLQIWDARDIADQEVIHTDPEKTEAIQQMKAPENVPEL